MHLSVEVAKIAQEWHISYPRLRPYGEPILIDLVSAGTITLPRTADFDPGLFENRDLALSVTTMKTPKEGDVARFGSYLFNVLLKPVWDDVVGRHDTDPLTAIELSSEDPEFHRLPWEMMRSPKGFLAEQAIGFIRLVSSAPTIPVPRIVTVAPRALFVIGSDLNDKRVKAGAEYLGLLRRLEAVSLKLETQILVRATRKSIEETVQRFRPSIVVFICHGSIGAQGTGQLELAPDDRSQKTDFVSGKVLRALLHGIPRVVVMNACESGASSRSSVPLAWEMIDDDTPLAIGMTGRVADTACRLFTRRFFEALLTGEEVHVATALARREGMRHGSEPERSVDWAMPALFMAKGVTVKVDRDAVAVMNERSMHARSFRKIMNPLVVCGRADCIAEFSAIMGAPAGTRVPRTLTLRVVEKYDGDYPARYGKTRVLEELAAMAALWGHVPCFVRKPALTLLGLALDIVTTILETRQEFGLSESPAYELFKLMAYMKSGNTPQPSGSVLTQLQLKRQEPGLPVEDIHPKVILAALQEDLAALRRDAAAQTGAVKDLRAVVFIDDLHFSPAAQSLMSEWISMYGLGGPSGTDVTGPHIVPLVLTYSSVDKVLYGHNAEAIRNVAESQTTTIANVDLRSLPPPRDDEMPYKQFMLSQKEMFMLPANDDPVKRDKFFDGLHKKIMGLPSRLEARWENGEVLTWVQAWAEAGMLVQADDEHIIKLLAQESGNGNR